MAKRIVFLGVLLTVFLLSQAAFADPNLVAYFNFDGNLTNQVGDGNDGTVVAGAVQYGKGAIGQGLYLDGKTAIDCNDIIYDNGIADITVMFYAATDDWPWPYDVSDPNHLISSPSLDPFITDANTQSPFVYAWHEDYQRDFMMIVGTGSQITAHREPEQKYPPGKLTHIACVFDVNEPVGGAGGGTGPHIKKIYLNGEEFATNTFTGYLTIPVATQSNMLVGGSLDPNTTDSYSHFYKGFIDELKFYDKAMSASEIQAAMGTPVEDPNLMTAFEFEGNLIGRYGDMINNWQDEEPNVDPGYAAGVDGNALDLDGDGDWIELNDPIFYADSTPSSTDWYTVMAWGRRDSLEDSSPLFYAGYEFVLKMSDNDVYVNLNQTGAEIQTTAWNNDNAWHHWTVTYDGTQKVASLYLDGELIGSDIGSTAGNHIYSAWKIGAGDNEDWPGEIDELRFYNAALSPDAIMFYMDGGEASDTKAWLPVPADGGEAAAVEAVLSWNAAVNDEVAQHKVYIELAGNPLTTVDVTVTDTDVNSTDIGLLSDLGFSTDYDWKVEECNSAGVPLGTADVWTFTTASNVDLDLFETYNSTLELDAVWDDNGGNVSLLTGDAADVSGAKCISLVNFNDSPASVTRTVGGSGLEEFSRDGALNHLSLWVRSNTDDNTKGSYFVELNDGSQTATVTHPDDQQPQRAYWAEWNIPLSAFIDANPLIDLDSIDTIEVGVDPSEDADCYVKIDDIRLYASRCVPQEIDVVLDDDQVFDDCVVGAVDLEVMHFNWLFEEQFTGQLVAKYDFESGVTDSSGHSPAADGTLEGAASIQDIGAPRNNVLVLDGAAGTYAEVTVDDSVDTLAFPRKFNFAAGGTICFWLYPTNMNAVNWNEILIDDDDTGLRAWQVGSNDPIDPDRGKIQFGFNSIPQDWSRTRIRSKKDTVTVNTWTHVACVFDPYAASKVDRMRIYKDGTQQSEGDVSYGVDTDQIVADPAARAGGSYGIGGNPDDSDGNFTGRIDDVMIFTRPLSDAEVAAIVAGTFTDTPAVQTDRIAGHANVHSSSNVVNFQDYAELAGEWMNDLVWP